MRVGASGHSGSIAAGGLCVSTSKSERIREMLEEAAPACRAMCTVDPNATLFFDLMADGAWWSDETPKEFDAISALRMVVRHRTCMICGIESPFGAAWEVAKELFPDWVGFREDRCRPSIEIVEQIRGMLVKGEREVEKLFRASDAYEKRASRRDD